MPSSRSLLGAPVVRPIAARVSRTFKSRMITSDKGASFLGAPEVRDYLLVYPQADALT